MTVQVIAEPKPEAPDASKTDLFGNWGKKTSYVVSFHDKAPPEAFKAAEKWVSDRGGNITESINDSYVKLLVAQMNDTILQLKEEQPEWIEEIEEDDSVWNDKDEL